MRKLLLTLACVFGMSTVASALTSSAVLLQHNGNITTYAAEDIAQAMAAAVDGDEIFLNEGKYPGFTISSAIKIKGAGQTTFIAGNIDIENTDKKLGDIFIGFLQLQGSLTGKTSLGKLELIQCYISSTFEQSGGTVEEVFMDRCDISSKSNPCFVQLGNSYEVKETVRDVTTTTIHPRVKKFTAINSKIKVYQRTNSYSAYPPYTIINCYADISSYETYGLTLINSIIYIGGYCTKYSELINCYGGGGQASNKYTGCYTGSEYGNTVADWTIYKLEDNGYFGNDGTVIGPLGGTRNTPFTLEPAVPRVTESSLKVDPQKKELNVTVTVTPK